MNENASSAERTLVAVDLFAGGGGTSEGVRAASGVSPLVAVNHDEHAIEMHKLNHPDTIHFLQNVYDVAPGECVPGRIIDLLTASPDCTYFSRAKGGKPLRRDIRALAWIVPKWATAIAPTVGLVENVPEFVDWGPLYTAEQVRDLAAALLGRALAFLPLPPTEPDLSEADWKARQANAWAVEAGLPKHVRVDRPIRERKGETFRAWVQALKDLGYAVEWRVLAACDYGTPTTRKRLFVLARRDGKPIVWPKPTHGPGRPKPWRVAGECIDWSIPCPSIFTRKRPLAEATQWRIVEGLRRYVLEAETPYLAPDGVAAAWWSNTSNGERKGQAARVRGLDQPLTTITATGSPGALVAAYLVKNNRGAHGQALDTPMHTVTSRDTKALVAAFLVKYYGSQTGQHQPLSEPLHTIVTRARFGLVTVLISGEPYTVVDIGYRMLRPRELARAQGLGEDYELTGTQAQQIARIGHSVCPQLAQALVQAQFGGPGCPDLPDLGDQVPLFGNRWSA